MVAVVLIGAGAVFAVSMWDDVRRVTIDRPDTEGSSGPIAQQDEEQQAPAENDPPETEPNDTEDAGLQTFLLVGSDSRSDLEDTEGFGDFGGNRADVVMVLFKDGSNTGLLSLPRDLLVEDPCVGGEDKLSQMLQGCQQINGPTLLTMAVEEMIGTSIDHFALVDLAGFQAAVDAIGGYEICVERPVRDRRANLELTEGCTQASGEQTLAWLRSRHTQELTDSGWRTMPGVSDLMRNERQREFLVDIMGRIADFGSPQAMSQAAQAVAPYVTVDSELSMMDAASLAWTLRGVGSASVTEISVPVYDDMTSQGAAVLRPSTPVDEVVAEFLTATASDAPDAVFGLAR